MAAGRRDMLGDHPVAPILLSTDLAVSRAFYHGVLGLDIVREDPGRTVYRSGVTQLVIRLHTARTRDAQTHMAWQVPDVRAAVGDLRQRGIRIEEYSAPDPVTVDGVADMGHSWVAWFVDPHDNVLAVVEAKA
jgi:catechol 2,3-dioxygenase-like lactoylglutathione lyase family enzyme